MALINCSECGSQMSDKAQSCPKCGAPNPNAPVQIPMGFSFNPCAWHSNAPAISSCVTCGRAMCKKCVDSAPFTLDGKPQCNECSLKMLEENITANRKTKIWSIVKLIFLLFFMFIGIMIYVSNPNDIMNAWIYAGIGGLPSSLKTFMTRSAEEKWADEAMSRVNPSEGCFQQMVAFIIKVIFAFVFAPVAAIWFTIKNSIAIVKSSRAIKADQEDYDTIQSRIKEMECLNEEQDSFNKKEPQITTQPTTYSPIQNQAPAEVPVQPETSQQVTLNQAPANVTYKQPVQDFQAPPVAPSYQIPKPTKRNNGLIIGSSIGALTLVGLIVGYFMWYVPYAKDRDALRTYVVANNVFLRSSKIAGVEYNILSTIPYGSELITYSKDGEWAEIKINGMKGFVASPYLLEWNDFKLLNDVWGSTDTKEYIESSKCRLAILDYCKRNQFNTGNDNWQLYTLQKNVKPNNVLFPRLSNGYDKFTEFAFILKNNKTQERRLAIYSFNEEDETPIFLYDEQAPHEGEIQDIKYRNKMFIVRYTGMFLVSQTPQPTINKPTSPVAPPTIPDIAPITENNTEQKPEETVDTNIIYQEVEQMPEYPGGINELMRFISQNLKYPSYCQENGIQGKVFVTFVIDRDGTPINFRIKQSPDPILGGEAVRVLRLMPKWKPGRQKGVTVKVSYTVPVNFRLG